MKQLLTITVLAVLSVACTNDVTDAPSTGGQGNTGGSAVVETTGGTSTGGASSGGHTSNSGGSEASGGDFGMGGEASATNAPACVAYPDFDDAPLCNEPGAACGETWHNYSTCPSSGIAIYRGTCGESMECDYAMPRQVGTSYKVYSDDGEQFSACECAL
jgi:hypothetical protein